MPIATVRNITVAARFSEDKLIALSRSWNKGLVCILYFFPVNANQKNDAYGIVLLICIVLVADLISVLVVTSVVIVVVITTISEAPEDATI